MFAFRVRFSGSADLIMPLSMTLNDPEPQFQGHSHMLPSHRTLAHRPPASQCSTAAVGRMLTNKRTNQPTSQQTNKQLTACHYENAAVTVHPVHLMTADLWTNRLAPCAPKSPPVVSQYPTSTIAIAIYYYYRAGRLIFILSARGR